MVELDGKFKKQNRKKRYVSKGKLYFYPMKSYML